MASDDLREQLAATLADHCPAHGLFGDTCERCTARTAAVMAVIEPAMLRAEVDNIQRAEQAEDLLRVAHDTSNRSETERARAVQRAEEAKAAVERVLKLHAEHDCDDCCCTLCWALGGMCGGCRNPWPCPTIRTLDQPKETP